MHDLLDNTLLGAVCTCGSGVAPATIPPIGTGSHGYDPAPCTAGVCLVNDLNPESFGT